MKRIKEYDDILEKIDVCCGECDHHRTIEKYAEEIGLSEDTSESLKVYYDYVTHYSFMRDADRRDHEKYF